MSGAIIDQITQSTKEKIEQKSKRIPPPESRQRLGGGSSLVDLLSTYNKVIDL
jgi:hypothetical protein